MAKEEFRAGAFTLVALGILSLFLVVVSGYSPWKKQITYRTRFNMAVGLDSGTPVRMNGVMVGQVLNVRLVEEDTEVEVVFGLNEDRRLTEGVRAEIATQGLIGDTFLLLTQTEPGRAVLPPDSLIPSEAKLDMAQTLNALGRLAAKVEVKIDQLSGRLETILDDLQQVFNRDRMDDLAAQMDRWQIHLTNVLSGLEELTKELNGLMGEAKLIVAKASSALDEDQAQVREILAEVNNRVARLGPKFERIADLLERAVKEDQTKLAGILDRGHEVMDQVEGVLDRGHGVADKVEGILDKGDEVVGRVDSLTRKTSKAADLSLEELVTIVHNLTQASRNLVVLTERLKDDPSLLIRRAESRP
ncbi:MAG: MCE family protein [Deltaproteobacteria bacterium]|nr:MCE family protein [Deltaproteobacteria bacterium]